jgi:hypothetical protein
MGRFRDADEDVLAVVRSVREEYFTSLQGAEIKVLMDTKKRTSGGKIVLGRMKKTTELEKHLSIGESGAGEGFDYIMYLDELAWDIGGEEDRRRLVRHELRHCEVQAEAANPYKVKGHDIEDFEEEIRLNQDHLSWGRELAERTQLEYEAEAERNRRQR